MTLKAVNAGGTEIGQGSGFFIQGGRIASNAHVVAGAAWVEVVGANGEFLGSVPYAEAVSVSEDLVVLPRVGGAGARVGLVVSSSVPPVGTPVLVIGTPRGLANTLSAGLVSAVREAGGRTLLQLTAPISSGSSGSPVVDSAGRVVGVVTSTVPEGQNINFAAVGKSLANLASSPPGRVALSGIESRTADERQQERSEDDPRYDLDVFVAAARSGDFFSRPGYRPGALTASDVVGANGVYSDFYRFRAMAGQRFTVRLESTAFDAQLLVTRLALDYNDWSIEDDDGAGGTNALIQDSAPETGEYVIWATSYSPGETGNYGLTLELASPTPTSRTNDPRWEYSARTDDNVSFVDRRRTRTSQGVEAWVRDEYLVPQPRTQYTLRHDGTETLRVFDCARRRVMTLTVRYFLGDDYVESYDFPDPSWNPVGPGSVGEAHLDLVCGTGK